MAGGEVFYKLFTKVVEQATKVTQTDVPAFKFRECCFSLPALADIAGTDYYRNDTHSLLAKYDKNYYTLVTIIIQKNVNGAWVDQVEVLNDDYGTWNGYGFATLGTLNYIGLDLEWQKVLNAFGEGSYRFRYKEIDFLMNTTYTVYPFEFCLRTYTVDRADFTTRFDFTNTGISGNWESDTDTWDYRPLKNGWINQLRLPESFFGYNKSEYTRDYIRYQNGQQVYLQDEQIEAYTWNSGHYPALLHDYIKTNIIQADELSVTDYNSNNPNIIKDKQIKPNSNYEPEWQYNNKRAFVNVDFVQEYQNRRKKRC